MDETPIWQHKQVPVDIETMRKIYTLHFQDGRSFLYLSRVMGKDQETIARYLREVALLHPYLDEIALDRAWWGDYHALCRLSIYEVEAFVQRMIDEPGHYQASDDLWARFPENIRLGLYDRAVKTRAKQAA